MDPEDVRRIVAGWKMVEEREREERRKAEDLEELESIRAYDAAKASGEEAIPFEQALRDRRINLPASTASGGLRPGLVTLEEGVAAADLADDQLKTR